MVDHLTFMALAMMGFLIWGLVMFSCYSYSYGYMVEMTWPGPTTAQAPTPASPMAPPTMCSLPTALTTVTSFLIWGLVMFSCYSYSYMAEMTWGCWTRLFTCRWSLIELIYSRECMFLPVRC